MTPSLVQSDLATVHSTILLNEKDDQFTGANNVEIVDPLAGMIRFAGNGREWLMNRRK
jgi:hypothetical protein